jgi:hypothetical protein
MIPYDELVAALSSWRSRQGLPSGPADYLGEPVASSYNYVQPATAYAAGYGDAGGDDVVDLSDDMMDSVVEEQASGYSDQTDDYAEQTAMEPDIDAFVEAAIPAEEPPAPEPEPSGGRRKRKR